MQFIDLHVCVHELSKQYVKLQHAAWQLLMTLINKSILFCICIKAFMQIIIYFGRAKWACLDEHRAVNIHIFKKTKVIIPSKLANECSFTYKLPTGTLFFPWQHVVFNFSGVLLRGECVPIWSDTLIGEGGVCFLVG